MRYTAGSPKKKLLTAQKLVSFYLLIFDNYILYDKLRACPVMCDSHVISNKLTILYMKNRACAVICDSHVIRNKIAIFYMKNSMCPVMCNSHADDD